MFKKVSHADGMTSEKEILFSTPFNYLFPDAARSSACLLPDEPSTVAGLMELGRAMADPGDTDCDGLDSEMPAVYTYFGQFIDHDITARTDRDTTASQLGGNPALRPRSPDQVITTLRNGRRPQLDLDSVFGDGPAMVGDAESQSQILYDAGLKLKTYEHEGRRDLPRDEHRVAIIPDERNDENLNVSQLQFAFLKFYNAIYDNLPCSISAKQKYIRARQLTRWAYQYVVVNDYLKTVCDPNVVDETLANGPRFISSTAGRGDAFMPLEFSTAGFRFGHSMIRPSYNLNRNQSKISIMDLIGFGSKPAFFEGTETQLSVHREVDWQFYVGGGSDVQFARRVDTRIAHGLGSLQARSSDPVLSHLAKSNLLRAYSLSIPTGQAVCDGYGVLPLTPSEILDGEETNIRDVLENYHFHEKTPLWYYVLREASVQQNGARLGEIGSRMVAETIIGLLKQDPNSYLNNRADIAVSGDWVDVKHGFGGRINELRDILHFAKVL